MNVFVMALFGALCWGIAPIFGKVGLRGINPMDGLAARTMITVMFIAGWILISGGFNRIALIPARCWHFLAVEAFLATFAGDMAYYAAIKKGDIGQTAIILATSPIITLWTGWFFLGEIVSPLQLAGAGLIIIGLILVGVSAIC